MTLHDAKLCVRSSLGTETSPNTFARAQEQQQQQPQPAPTLLSDYLLQPFLSLSELPTDRLFFRLINSALGIPPFHCHPPSLLVFGAHMHMHVVGPKLLAMLRADAASWDPSLSSGLQTSACTKCLARIHIPAPNLLLLLLRDCLSAQICTGFSTLEPVPVRLWSAARPEPHQYGLSSPCSSQFPIIDYDTTSSPRLLTLPLVGSASSRGKRRRNDRTASCLCLGHSRGRISGHRHCARAPAHVTRSLAQWHELSNLYLSFTTIPLQSRICLIIIIHQAL